jgi:hypothetical protein
VPWHTGQVCAPDPLQTGSVIEVPMNPYPSQLMQRTNPLPPQ